MSDKVAELGIQDIRDSLGRNGGWKSRALGAEKANTEVVKLKKERNLLKQQVKTDELTGLPNEIALKDELSKLDLIRKRYVDKGEENSEKVPVGTIIALDLTQLKKVNDEIGHSFGDLYLQIVTHSLEESLRPGDSKYRLTEGSDEFVVILPDLVDEKDINEVEDRIDDSISKKQGELPNFKMGVSFVAGRFGISAPASYTKFRVLEDLGQAKKQKNLEGKRGESVGRIIAC